MWQCQVLSLLEADIDGETLPDDHIPVASAHPPRGRIPQCPPRRRCFGAARAREQTGDATPPKEPLNPFGVQGIHPLVGEFEGLKAPQGSPQRGDWFSARSMMGCRPAAAAIITTFGVGDQLDLARNAAAPFREPAQFARATCLYSESERSRIKAGCSPLKWRSSSCFKLEPQ